VEAVTEVEVEVVAAVTEVVDVMEVVVKAAEDIIKAIAASKVLKADKVTSFVVPWADTTVASVTVADAMVAMAKAAA